MSTEKKHVRTKVFSALLIFTLLASLILAPTVLAVGNKDNFTPTEAAGDSEIQEMTDNSSVLSHNHRLSRWLELAL